MLSLDVCASYFFCYTVKSTLKCLMDNGLSEGAKYPLDGKSTPRDCYAQGDILSVIQPPLSLSTVVWKTAVCQVLPTQASPESCVMLLPLIWETEVRQCNS